MSRLIAALRRHADDCRQRIALQDDRRAIAYGELLPTVETLARRFHILAPRTVGLLADNGTDWALADLAATLAGVPVVPLPPFFSAGQLEHVLRSAGIDLVLTDQPQNLFALPGIGPLRGEPFHGTLQAFRLPAPASAALPRGTAKLTFTSGTTGEPKGVCLGREEMERVAASLCVASAASRDDRHLCLLPLATLLENLGGIHTPLLAGATVCLPGLAAVGLTGSSGLNVRRLLGALTEWRASSAIMVPQMLQAVVAAGLAGAPLPKTLRYLAVGGAPVSGGLLAEAERLGLPVFEGYGLSECASVVAVNGPGQRRPGSVGKPLPHLELRFAEDGEILVGKLPWRGYLGDPAPAAGPWIATGDLGHLDADGYLYLTGRKKNLFITAFGRNVAPEWVERELVARPGILQAAVFGEARPFNSAVIVADPAAGAAEVDAALDDANRRLPDYARVGAWVRADAPFTPGNEMATANGRLRRQHILGRYGARLDALYQP